MSARVYAWLRRNRWVWRQCLRIVMPYAKRANVRDVARQEYSREWLFMLAVPDEAIADNTVYYFDPQVALSVQRVKQL